MKKICVVIVAGCLCIFSMTLQAETEQSSLNERLFSSIIEQDLNKFKESLSLGADPNVATDGRYYLSSALCEATKVGNDQYLDAIAEAVLHLDFNYNSALYNSPATCAIGYRNKAALEKFMSMGLDVGVVLDPEAPAILQFTLLDVALNIGSVDIVWYLMQIVEPNDRQIQSLVRSVERSGGYIGHYYVPYIQKIVSWLREKGVKVQPKPPRPAPTLVPRTIK